MENTLEKKLEEEKVSLVKRIGYVLLDNDPKRKTKEGETPAPEMPYVFLSSIGAVLDLYAGLHLINNDPGLLHLVLFTVGTPLILAGAYMVNKIENRPKTY